MASTFQARSIANVFLLFGDRFGSGHSLKISLIMLLGFLVAVAPSASPSEANLDARDPRSPLHLVRIIELPDVRGRIDHMALDPQRNHLVVAEYGNGSIDDIDLATGQVAGRITGLHQPQGVAWLPRQSEIVVASGDGSLRFYRGADRKEVARIDLDNDADNVRFDSRNGDLVVGYGSGALAVINPVTHRIIRQLKLPAHPEAFTILGSRVFVNVPDAHAIVVGDLDQAQVVAKLSTGALSGNYPMASDTGGTRIAIAYRFPSKLSVIDAQAGVTSFSASICADADDLYFHPPWIVVVCGGGAIELIDEAAGHRSLQVATQRGARTGLLLPDRNRLFVAVPANFGPAAIWELSFR